MKNLPLYIIGFALAAFGASSHAAVYTVGNGTGCTHGTIQSAIDAANSHAGYDTIRLTRSLTYSPESNTVNTSDDLSIVGGFATCTQSASDGIYTDVSGQGVNSGSAVFDITANGTAIVKLRHLDITNGNVGIRFNGTGILQTIETTIERNVVSGIYATATSNNAELVIDTGTLVIDNGSPGCLIFNLGPNGGGIHIDGPIEMTMTAPQTMIAFNSACTGGGLYVDEGAYAYVGSPGYNGLPAINQNTAEWLGGGAYVAGTLKLFTTDSGHPIGISHNTSATDGGGIFVDGANARLCAWDFVIDDNTADGNGGAIYGDTGTIILNRNGYQGCAPHPVAVSCAVGVACNSISGNTNTGAETNNALGATIDLSHASLVGRRLSLRNNNSAAAIRSVDSIVSVDECLVADNLVSGTLLRSNLEDSQSESSLYLKNCTVAGNHISIGSVAQSNDFLYLFNSIIYQPNTPTLNFTGPQGGLSLDSLMVDNGSNVPPGPTIARGISPFIAPQAGDYHLLHNSAAIDFAAAIVSDAFDLDGNPRDIDLPYATNFNGPRDLGAYEWNPLIRNGWFDGNLSWWTYFDGTWDGAENASGNAGSGAWKIQRDVKPPVEGALPLAVLAGSFNVGEQCVRLPGSGRYLLNGWGKGGGNFMFYDSAVLAWEFRRNGGADCSGTPDASGERTLSSGAWAHPAQPATIDVSATEFHAGGSTLKVRLLARTNKATGTMSVWFDGITLDFESGADVIFANGFE